PASAVSSKVNPATKVEVAAISTSPEAVEKVVTPKAAVAIISETAPGKAQEKAITFSSAAVSNRTQKIPFGAVLGRVPERLELLQRLPLGKRMLARFFAWKARLFPKRSRKKTGNSFVQGEWSLEKVRVARNDLAEADLEIVRVPRKEKATGQKSQTEIERGNAGAGWLKKTSGFFKAASPFGSSAGEKIFAAPGRNEKNETELAGHL
ncbi:MAG: hypothetical protein ABJC04_02635, partial [Verrucomicrobiota bacterium]